MLTVEDVHAERQEPDGCSFGVPSYYLHVAQPEAHYICQESVKHRCVLESIVIPTKKREERAD